ncbi:hypothetical protein D3C73_758170 [compost metagenome]
MRQQRGHRGVLAPTAAPQLVLHVAVRNGGQHRQARIAFHVIRFRQTAEQRIAHKRAQHAEDQADDRGHADNDRGLRAHGAVRLHRGVQDAHVAHLAGADQAQLLRVVQEARVQLGVDPHITHQAHHVLLQVRQLLDVVADAADVVRQRSNLPIDGHNAGMARRKARDQFLALGAQVHHPRLRFNRLAQDQLGLFAQVDGAALVAQGVVLGFGGIQFALEQRQLLFQKAQRLLGLRRLAVHVLLHVFLADLVQHGGGQRRVVAFQRDADHARRTAPLEDAHVRLHVFNRRQARAARDGELRAGAARQRVDMHVHHAATGQAELFGLAHRAAERGARELVGHRVAPFALRGHDERLAQPFVGHVQVRDRDRLTAPGVAAARQAGGIRQGFVALCQPFAHYGEVARLGVDVQQELIDRGPHHHARTQHFHFARGLCLGIEHGRHIAQQAARLPIGRFFFNLHDDVG